MSVEVEKHLIGAVLLDYKRCYPLASAIVNMNDFKEPRNASIWGIIARLESEGKDIDAITVSEQSKISGFPVKITELMEMQEHTIMAHVETYAEQVKEASKKNTLFKNLIKSKERLLAGDSFENVINELMDTISGLEADKISEFVEAKDCINDIYEIVKQGKQQGIQTGYEKIDKITKGLHKSNLIVLAADTGKGKTAFAMNIVAHVLSHDKTVLWYSLEMSAEENIKRLLSIISRTNSNIPDAHLTEDEVKERLDGCGRISRYNLLINDKQQSVNTIRATAKAKVNELLRQGRHIDMIVVDYVQIMTANKAENRQGEVAGIAQNLKGLAKELNVPVMVLSQVNADYEKEKRALRLNDLRESKAIGHAADLVFFLNKKKEDEFDPDYVMNCLKNRHGALFFMPLRFVREFTIFEEVI